ncbi:MAG TPA: sigma-70 family RNA polymerase sigma factor [Blastocatellia bacterium]|nr:sigma-70 family RNA polymerase sigma factor [Blastocatellia bacterium]
MKDDELDLWKRYHEGEEKAFDELLEYYKRLVRFWVKGIIVKSPRADRDDLIQEGMIKLQKLIQGFDPGRGGEFISYAGWRLRDALLDSLKRSRNMPDYQYKKHRKVINAQDALIQRLRRAPTLAEIAQEAGLTLKQVERAIDAMSVAFPEEFIAQDTDLPISVRTVENPDDRILIGELLLKLDERKRLILTEYYYWGCTDLEIANQLGLNKDNVKRIRQRATEALLKLIEEKPGG